MPKNTSEFKVGLFAVGALILLMAMILFVGNRTLLQKGYTFKVVFNYTGGIAGGAPVMMSGVEIGRVNGIELIDDGRAKVEIVVWVQEQVKIREGAEFTIQTFGLLGEKFIEIYAGEGPIETIGPDTVFAGRDPVQFARAMEMGEDMFRKLNDVAASLHTLIAETDAKEKLSSILTNAQEASQKLNVLLTDVSRIVGDNRLDVKETVTNFREISGSLNTEMDNISRAIHSFKNILGTVEGGQGTLGKLVVSEELYDDLRAFIKDIEANPWKLFRRERKK